VNFLILYNLSYPWANNDSLFHFNLTQLGELVSQKHPSLTLSAITLRKIYIKPSVMCRGLDKHLDVSLMFRKKFSFFLEAKCVAEGSLYAHSDISCGDCPIYIINRNI
jgi:hypothetical protein